MNHLHFAIVVSVFAGNVLSKECNCGQLCKQFQGKQIGESCFYIAGVNPLHGTQFLVGSQKHENVIVDSLLGGNTSSAKLFISTKLSYRLLRFKNMCYGSNCTETVYSAECICKLNFFENILQHLNKLFYEHTEIFWCIIVVLLIFLLLCVIKCFCCCNNNI